MRKNILLVSFILIILPGVTIAHVCSTFIDTVLVLKNANILSKDGKKFLAAKDITIQGGEIVRIGRSAKHTDGARVIDLSGKYVIPGLIDAHVHVTAKYKNNLENTFNDLNYYLRHGITSVRDAAGDGDALLKAQIAIRKGERSGSDVFFASFMAGDWYYNRGQNIRKDPYTPWEQRLVPGDDLDKAMADAKACGATGVKLYHSFEKKFLKNIVRAARRHGLLVWGHAMMYPANPIEVAQAGVEVLSHVSMLEAMKTDTLFNRRTTAMAYKDSVIASIDITPFCRMMKKHGAILDATLCVSEERSPWVFPLLKRVHEQAVKISAGTDQIVDLNRSNPRLFDELDYFVNKCGFTPAEALYSATQISAEVIGQQQNRGSIKVGKRADLLILESNPLLDITSLRNIQSVIQHGKIIAK